MDGPSLQQESDNNNHFKNIRERAGTSVYVVGKKNIQAESFQIKIVVS